MATHDNEWTLVYLNQDGTWATPFKAHWDADPWLIHESGYLIPAALVWR